MGTSTDAELFYGYVWKSSYEEMEDEELGMKFEALEEKDWEEIVLTERGVVNPWDSEGDDGILLPADPETPWAARGFTEIGRMLLDKWHKDKSDVSEEFGVEFFTHGGPEWRCPAVALKHTRTTASRGFPEEINWEEMSPGRHWNVKLDVWLQAMGIVLDPDTKGAEWDGPGWWLVSDWI